MELFTVGRQTSPAHLQPLSTVLDTALPRRLQLVAMAEYWKSTPKYWCKFCETYVRDTGIERKNHKTSAKHQGSIQRSLRELHKGQAQQQRDAQRAKNEVARLNGIVGGKSTSASTTTTQTGPSFTRTPRIDPASVDYAAHRRAQAQQLIALGMRVPDELKEDVTGVSKWQTVSERTIVNEQEAEAITANGTAVRIKGVHKRKVEDVDDEEVEALAASRRKVWGNTLKSYPGKAMDEDDPNNLEALLDGISRKQTVTNPDIQHVVDTEGTPLKQEVVDTQSASADDLEIKQPANESAVTAPPIVAFKKRKGKK